MLSLLDKGLQTTATSTMGPISDIGLVLEGVTPDKIGYKVLFGPYDEKNVLMSLRIRPSADDLKILSEADLFFDLDLFELNFSFSEHSLFRWGETKIERAVDFVARASGDPVKETTDGGRRKSNR